MKRLITLSLSIWFAFAFLVGGQAFSAPNARKKPTPPTTNKTAFSETLRLFPKESQVVLSLSDLKGQHKALAQTPLWKLISDKETQPMVQFLLKRVFARRLGLHRRRGFVKQFVNVFTALTGVHPIKGLEIFQGPHVLALVDLPSGSSPLKIASVLGFNDAKAAHKMLDTLLSRIPFHRSTLTHNGIKINVLKGLENALYIAALKDRFLITTTAPLLNSMLDRLKKPQESLLQSPSFKQFMKKTDFQGGLSLYIATHSLLQSLMAGGMQRKIAPLRLLGIDQWKSTGLTFSIQRRRFRTQLHITHNNPSSIKGLSTSLPTPETLKYIPTNTVLTVLSRIPWVRFWDDAWARFGKIVSKAEKDGTLAQMGQLERAFLGFSLRDLVKAIGNETTFALHLPKQGGLFPQLTIALKLQDPRLTKRALLTFARLTQLKPKKLDYKGIPYLRFHQPSPYRRYRRYNRYNRYRRYRRHRRYRSSRKSAIPYSIRRLFRPLKIPLSSLTFCFLDSTLLISYTPQNLWDTIDRFKQKQAAKNKLKHSKNKHFYAQWDFRELLPRYYNSFLSAAPQLQSNRFIRRFLGVTIAPEKLPRTQTLTHYIRPEHFSLRFGSADTHAEINTGLGTQGLLVGGVFFAAFEKLFLQFPIRRYMREISKYMWLEKKEKTLLAEQRYQALLNRWKQVAQRSMLEAIAMIARKKQKTYTALLAQHRKTLFAELKKADPKKVLGDWELHGDWQIKNGVFQTKGSFGQQNYLVFGDSQNDSYVLELEVQRPNRGFTLGLHMQDSNRPNWYRPMRSISFSERQFPKGKWTPLRIKVKHHRISYWFGMRHRVLRASQKSGKIGIYMPYRGQLMFRNIRLHIAPRPKTPKLPSVPAYPSVRLSFYGAPQSIQAGESCSHYLTVENRGGSPAKQVRLTISLPKQLQFVKMTTSPKMPFKWNAQKRTLTLASGFTLHPQKRFRMIIQTRAVGKKGSANAQARLTFSELRGEIFSETHTQLLP